MLQTTDLMNLKGYYNLPDVEVQSKYMFTQGEIDMLMSVYLRKTSKPLFYQNKFLVQQKARGYFENIPLDASLYDLVNNCRLVD